MCIAGSRETESMETHETVDRALPFQEIRRLAKASLDHSCEEAVACVSLSLGGLDRTRSTLGYLAGEQVLSLCLKRLAGEVRDTDWVINLGGDALAVLLHGLAERDLLEKVVSRLRERLQASLLIEGQVVDLDVAVGIATGSPDLEPDTLFRRSSMALRSAESEACGRMRFFEEGMERRLSLEQAMLRDLRRALPLRQFLLYYQPQVDLRSRKIVAYEALIRWKHPELGMISPADFIPMAEATGTIQSIGAWVLKVACKQILELGPEISVSVNVSPVQFQSNTFLEDVRKALSTSGLAGSRLEIELTEGVLLLDSASTMRTVKRLGEMGVRLAMDDYGTGYSSLSQLAKVPFNTLKLDRSLVGRDSKKRAVVRSAIALADGLEMAALAEGVETASDLQALVEDGCFLFQGYYFGKPTPISEVQANTSRINTLLKLPSKRADACALG